MPKQRKNRSRSKRRVSRKRTRRRTRRTRRTRRIRGGSGADGKGGKGSPETYKEWEDRLGGDPQEEELDDEAVAPDELVPPEQLEMAGLPLAQQIHDNTGVIYGAPPEGEPDDEAGKRLPDGHLNVASSSAPPVPSFVAPVPVPSFDMPSASAMEHFIMNSSGEVLRRALKIRKKHKRSKLQEWARWPTNTELIGQAVISTQKYKGSHKGNKGNK